MISLQGIKMTERVITNYKCSQRFYSGRIKNRNLGDFLCFLTQNFFSKITLLGLILCEESIACILEAWKRSSDPDSGKWVFLNEAKIENFWISCLKIIFQEVILCGDCAHFGILKMLPWPWFRKIRMFIEAKIGDVLISLNQDQGSIFKLREWYIKFINS
jgi:hypothetical protein